MRPAGRERLRRSARLRSPKDFRRISREGRRVAGRCFIILAAPQRGKAPPEPGPRLGVTVGRRVGGAVARNRIKRRIREWFRRRQAGLPRGMDWVVIARSTAARATTVELERELDAGLAELGDQGAA